MVDSVINFDRLNQLIKKNAVTIFINSSYCRISNVVFSYSCDGIDCLSVTCHFGLLVFWWNRCQLYLYLIDFLFFFSLHCFTFWWQRPTNGNWCRLCIFSLNSDICPKGFILLPKRGTGNLKRILATRYNVLPLYSVFLCLSMAIVTFIKRNVYSRLSQVAFVQSSQAFHLPKVFSAKLFMVFYIETLIFESAEHLTVTLQEILLFAASLKYFNGKWYPSKREGCTDWRNRRTNSNISAKTRSSVSTLCKPIIHKFYWRVFGQFIDESTVALLSVRYLCPFYCNHSTNHISHTRFLPFDCTSILLIEQHVSNCSKPAILQPRSGQTFQLSVLIITLPELCLTLQSARFTMRCNNVPMQFLVE